MNVIERTESAETNGVEKLARDGLTIYVSISDEVGREH